MLRSAMVGRRQPEHLSSGSFLSLSLIRRLARGEGYLYSVLPRDALTAQAGPWDGQSSLPGS